MKIDKTHQNPRTKIVRWGFTLIELLVVVAIIALLIAILIPSLARAKHLSRSVACLSNLRQFSIGFNAYSMEYAGALPAPYFQAGTTTKPDITWQSSLWQYVLKMTLTDTQLEVPKHPYLQRTAFICPEGLLDVTTGDAVSMSYAMNSSLPDVPRKVTFGVQPPEESQFKMLKLAVNPSRTLMVADGNYPAVGAFSTGDKSGIVTMSGQGDVFDSVALPNQQNRHTTCLNIAMADGSGRTWRWYKSTEVPVPNMASMPPNPTLDMCLPEVQMFWRGF
jgi:prepilin-type N-terminal cleavage/methylation domain-containing protein